MPETKTELFDPRATIVPAPQNYGDQMAPAIAAAAAAAKAEIEARIIHALNHPRDEDLFGQKLLKSCRHPRFAEVALYRRPVGGGKVAVNFSIRFIETALKFYGNLHIASKIVYEDAESVKQAVAVVDVENNLGYSQEAVIEKVVERKEVREGRTQRGMRENSAGEMVYRIEATRDEVRNLLGVERSKLIRDQGQRLLPRHILDEARDLIEATLEDATAKDPDSAKKKILGKFAALGVNAVMLKEYLGRPIETLVAKDMTDLTALYNGLKEGDFNWADVMRKKQEPAEGEAPAPPETARRMRERILAKTQAVQEELGSTQVEKPSTPVDPEPTESSKP